MQFSQIPGPTEDILIKQRRAASLYKNNPHLVLESSVNTFDGTPLGGDIDPNMPGYEDAPGSKYGMADIKLDNIISNEYPPKNVVESSDSEEWDNADKPIEIPDKYLETLKEEFAPTSNNILIGILLLLIVLWIVYLFFKK